MVVIHHIITWNRFQNSTKRNTLIISAVVDDMIVSCTNQPFITRNILSIQNEIIHRRK